MSTNIFLMNAITFAGSFNQNRITKRDFSKQLLGEMPKVDNNLRCSKSFAIKLLKWRK
jgi:hypothetical protein